MASFAPDIKSRMNKKNFGDLKMAEKCLERLGFEPTTILNYNKVLSNFRGHSGGQGTTGQERDQCLRVRTGMHNNLHLVSSLPIFAEKLWKTLLIRKMT